MSRLIIDAAAAAVAATGSSITVGAGAAGGGAVARLLPGERPGGVGGPGGSTGGEAPGGSTGSEWPGTAAGAAGPAHPAGPVQVAGPGGVPGSAGADRARPAGWWQAWRARFGLAEVCGTGAAMAGFAVGYPQGGSPLGAAGPATPCGGNGVFGRLRG